MRKIRVKAAPGMKVPREDSSRRYITDGEPVEVYESTYYVRRIRDRELVEVNDTQSTPANTPRGDR